MTGDESGKEQRSMLLVYNAQMLQENMLSFHTCFSRLSYCPFLSLYFAVVFFHIFVFFVYLCYLFLSKLSFDYYFCGGFSNQFI